MSTPTIWEILDDAEVQASFQRLADYAADIKASASLEETAGFAECLLTEVDILRLSLVLAAGGEQ